MVRVFVSIYVCMSHYCASHWLEFFTFGNCTFYSNIDIGTARKKIILADRQTDVLTDKQIAMLIQIGRN